EDWPRAGPCFRSRWKITCATRRHGAGASQWHRAPQSLHEVRFKMVVDRHDEWRYLQRHRGARLVSLIRASASCILLGIFLMPSPRILDPDRTHSRHATCEHHLRRHHPDPADRARILARAERKKRRAEARARLEEASARARQERVERAL